MSRTETEFGAPASSASAGWRELWRKEDWWAIWLGLGLVLAGYLLFVNGSSLRWIAVTPAKWATGAQLLAHFQDNIARYLAQFLLWLVTFAIALTALGHRARDFVPAFVFLYLVSVVIFVIGQWDQASTYNLEPPLVALVLGLVLSNLVGLPRWLDAGFRVEFYVKTGIVLLGATLPFTLIVWAGPVAIFQASIVSIVTFLVIYWVAVRLTLVIIWAIVMIFGLPFASAALLLPAGIGGAWIGTSEFADAAGFAAAQAYGALAGKNGIAGTADQAVFAFTLMKVVGRDVWIGIWAFVLAIVATTRWERTATGGRPDIAQIWWRFPKFVIGFIAASLIVTAATSGYSLADFNKTVNPALVAPLKDLRSWAFIFCFFSIGLTTRFRELANAGAKPFLAFSAGVAVNVVLGFVLSAYVFAAHWANLAR